ncbi:hypothetical protein BU109_13685, partial [Staphylococcus xylosus]
VNELTNQSFKQLTTEDIQQYGLRSTTIEQLQFKSVKNQGYRTLNIERLQFKYQGQQSLVLNINPVKLEIGARTAVMGENGAGKTT